MNNYAFGFSLLGLLFYALQLLPNIIWMVKPPANNVLTQNSSPYKILNITEQGCGILTVALLILLVNKSGEGTPIFYLVLAILFLLGYYIAWVFYYKGVVHPWLLIIGIAAMPPLYFISVGLWLNNLIALIPCVIFGIAHIVITCSTYLKS